MENNNIQVFGLESKDHRFLYIRTGFGDELDVACCAGIKLEEMDIDLDYRFKVPTGKKIFSGYIEEKYPLTSDRIKLKQKIIGVNVDPIHIFIPFKELKDFAARLPQGRVYLQQCLAMIHTFISKEKNINKSSEGDFVDKSVIIYRVIYQELKGK